VYALNSDRLERAPQTLIGESHEYRVCGIGDRCRRISGEPDRGTGYRGMGLRLTVGV